MRARELLVGQENEQNFSAAVDEKYVTFCHTLEWETQGSTIKCHLQ